MPPTPPLSAEQVDALMSPAASIAPATLGTVYTEADLNRAVATGWQWKAALTSDRYDLGGGPGRSLTESQWHAHCTRMADRYRTGSWSVLGGSGTRSRGIGVVNLVTPQYVDGDV